MLKEPVPEKRDLAGAETRTNATITPDSLMEKAGQSSATAAMSGAYFDTRRGLGTGTVIMREQIAQRRYRDLGAVFADVGQIEALRQVEVHLDSGTLPASPERIH